MSHPDFFAKSEDMLFQPTILIVGEQAKWNQERFQPFSCTLPSRENR